MRTLAVNFVDHLDVQSRACGLKTRNGLLNLDTIPGGYADSCRAEERLRFRGRNLQKLPIQLENLQSVRARINHSYIED